jgi:UDP-glucose 4-epimerase
MRIAVTGLSGNIGSALLRRLAVRSHEVGDVGVVGVCRRPPRSDGSQPLYRRARWVSQDLAAPDARERLAEAFAEADAVVHLAWLFQPSHDIAYLERACVGGTAAVLGACQDAGVGHLVHMSSLGVYSPGPADPAGPRVDESWPHEGIPTSVYSRHKAAAERLLDERPHDRPPLVTRLRPALVMQSAAASALLRYGLPSWVPSSVLRWLRVLPLDRRLAVQTVHSDDVADAVLAVLQQRAEGAFNLAAEPPITAADLAGALGAHLVHLPAPVLRTAVALSWHTGVQPLDPGWIDLAFASPLMDTTRARTALGWSPGLPADDTLRELVRGMLHGSAGGSPALRPRSVPGSVWDTLRRGPVSRRQLT